MLQHFTKKSVESKASGKAVRMKRCIRLNLKAKISQFFKSSAYVTLLSTTGSGAPNEDIVQNHLT